MLRSVKSNLRFTFFTAFFLRYQTRAPNYTAVRFFFINIVNVTRQSAIFFHSVLSEIFKQYLESCRYNT